MSNKKVTIHPCPPISASIRPPGSKSITNRALVCAALAQGTSVLQGVLDSEDTRVMLQALHDLGVPMEQDLAGASVTISGIHGKFPVKSADLFLANSGTSIRFLTAALCTAEGRYRLDGVSRMRQRPIADLLSALRQLGGNVRSLNEADPDCPPVLVEAHGLRGGQAEVAGNISSQFLSGLLLAAPMAQEDTVLKVQGELVSQPYVEMTARVMQSFGAEAIQQDEHTFVIHAARKYQAANYAIEPDASAASYFWAAAAIAGGTARVEGLHQQSLQGDVRFCKLLQQMGCQVRYLPDAIEVTGGAPLVGIDVDMSDISDTVQTLAAVALFAQGPTTVRGVAHNRVKETDRISDLARELRKLGASVDEFQDGLRIHPPHDILPADIDTYHDHRMAMSLSLVGLKRAGICIRDPDCTAKTYPQFWQDLAKFTKGRVVANGS